MGRLLNVLIGLDETGNALLGGLPGETISGTVGRAYMERPEKWCICFTRWVLDHVFGPGHCIRAASRELAIRVTVRTFDDQSGL